MDLCQLVRPLSCRRHPQQGQAYSWDPTGRTQQTRSGKRCRRKQSRTLKVFLTPIIMRDLTASSHFNFILGRLFVVLLTVGNAVETSMVLI